MVPNRLGRGKEHQKILTFVEYENQYSPDHKCRVAWGLANFSKHINWGEVYDKNGGRGRIITGDCWGNEL